MTFSFSIDHWELTAPFTTSGETQFAIETLTVYLDDGTHRGRGEALGVDYLGEAAQGLSHQLMGISREIEAARHPDEAQDLLPPGGARNALDCALWDLWCKREGRRAWELAGREAAPVTTAYTLSLDTPEAMAAEAAAHRDLPVLKLKLDADAVPERLAAVRAAHPEAELLVDANGAWTASLLDGLGDVLARHRVALVEQPLPRSGDEALAGLECPVPLCADESCQHLGELDTVAARYDVVNIKLDKCGGLSAGLTLLDACHERGLETMVGNMLGSSLAMAPAFLVAQGCAWVDLDGPLWQRADRRHALRFERGRMSAPEPGLWG